MKALIHDNNGVLSWSEIDRPICKQDELLIRVEAIGINRADLLQRKGLYPPPEGEPDIMGLELAGEVVESGDALSEKYLGTKVMALVPSAAYAEYVKVNHRLVFRIPEAFSVEMAAALPEALFTTYLNLFFEAKLKSNESVLIHSGAGAIGHIAIQMAKIMGAQVITTSGSDDKCNFCEELGADLALNYKKNWSGELLAVYDGVDVIFDTVGKNYVEQHLEILNQNSRWQLIGLLSGIKSEIDLSRVLKKNIQLKGSTLRNKSTSFKAELAEQIKDKFGIYLNDGSIRPFIDSVFPIQNADEAHQRIKSNLVKGKVILTV